MMKHKQDTVDANVNGVGFLLKKNKIDTFEGHGRLAGKGGEVARLVGSLEIDAGALRRELGWRPVKTLREGLQLTADWFTGARHR